MDPPSLALRNPSGEAKLANTGKICFQRGKSPDSKASGGSRGDTGKGRSGVGNSVAGCAETGTPVSCGEASSRWPGVWGLITGAFPPPRACLVLARCAPGWTFQGGTPHKGSA